MAEDSLEMKLVLVGIFIALCFLVPWAWRFLLRRLRELADAVRGKD